MSAYKRTPTVRKRLLLSLKRGTTRTAACAFAGISLATLARWIEEDAEFAEAIACAEGCAEESMAAALFKAGKADWRAAESWLKRRRRSEWGDSLTAEHTGAGGGPMRVLHEGLDRLYGDEEDAGGAGA